MKSISASYPRFQGQYGFTMVELLVTISLAGILTTMAVPSFSSMTQSNRLTTQTNQLVTALNVARNEAVTRRTPIDVTATNSSNAANEWGPGWTVAVNGGATLRIFQPLEGGSTLDATNNLGTIQYLANGRASATETFTLCDGRTGETGREITVLRSGTIFTNTITCL